MAPMLSSRTQVPLLLVAALVFSSGCARADRAAPSASMEAAPAAAPTSGSPATGGQAKPGANATPTPADTRRIIRVADVGLETDSPDDAQKKITALADATGGFVVSSDTQRYKGEDGSESVSTTIVFRVPSTAFESTLEKLRAIGTRVASEKVTGQDVTEEYLDLEARLRTQRAIEEQYLSILKEAKTINDTLAVQQKLGEVRGEIERAEGRRRYLENQTSLSTLTVHLSKHIEAVDAEGPGFGRSVKRAAHDSVDVAVGIVNGIIRTIGVLLPIFLLLVLPVYLVIRFFVRRRRRLRAAAS